MDAEEEALYQENPKNKRLTLSYLMKHLIDKNSDSLSTIEKFNSYENQIKEQEKQLAQLYEQLELNNVEMSKLKELALKQSVQPEEPEVVSFEVENENDESIKVDYDSFEKMSIKHSEDALSNISRDFDQQDEIDCMIEKFEVN